MKESMMQKILFNIVILIFCYVNTLYSSEELMERRPLNHYAIPLSIEEIMIELSPDIMLCLCQRVSLQDVKHLSEVSKHYSKYIRPQILIMKAAQRLNNGIAIERNPSNLQLKFIKAIVTGNFKFEIHYSRKSDYVNYGIKDNGNMITVDDKTPLYDMHHEPNNFFKIHGKNYSTAKGSNFCHLINKIHATAKKNSSGKHQVHIKTNSEERFLEHPKKAYTSSPIMVSADGNTIVGWMQGKFGGYINLEVPFVYTNQKGMKQLPSYRPDMRRLSCYPHEQLSLCKLCDKHERLMPGYASCVSGDGKVIGGLLESKPAVWIDGSLPFLLEDFIKAPKLIEEKLFTLTDLRRISPQGESWFGHGHYISNKGNMMKFFWIIKFDFDKEVITNAEKSVAVSKKRKRVKISQN